MVFPFLGLSCLETVQGRGVRQLPSQRVMAPPAAGGQVSSDAAPAVLPQGEVEEDVDMTPALPPGWPPPQLPSHLSQRRHPGRPPPQLPSRRCLSLRRRHLPRRRALSLLPAQTRLLRRQLALQRPLPPLLRHRRRRPGPPVPAQTHSKPAENVCVAAVSPLPLPPSPARLHRRRGPPR